MKRLTSLLAAGLLACAAVPAAADTFPSKQITLVVPFAAGSGTDTVARVVAQHLGQALGQTVVVDNKAGANGAIAAVFVARAAPDGHTLFMTTNTSHSANPSLFKNLSYDPVKDFAPVSRIGNLPFMMVVNPEIPAKTVQDFVAHAKANAGKLAFASGNSTGIVAGETLKRRGGIDVLHVPYKSTPPAINDLLAGRVSMMFVDLTSGIAHVRSGGLRALAVTTAERSVILPDLPAMREAGVADFDLNSWNGVFAPAGTPKPVIDRINAELRKIIANPEVKKRLADVGFDAFSSTPEELDAFIKSELVKWAKLIKDAGIEPQ